MRIGRRVSAMLLAVLLAVLAFTTPSRVESYERVSFPSLDADLTGGAPTRLSGLLYRPAGDGPFPAVVLLHGCGGLLAADGKPTGRDSSWASLLRDKGYVALLVDSFAPRGHGSLCSQRGRDRPAMSDRERVRDAYAALIFLQSQPNIRPGQVGVLGWSDGGATVLAAVADGARFRPALPVAGFRAAVAFYPGGCLQANKLGWTTRTPLLMLLGEKDEWTPANACVKLSERAKAGGAPAHFYLYPDAHHGFDAPDQPMRVLTHVVLPGGRSPTTGTHSQARADALERVPTFLERHLMQP